MALWSRRLFREGKSRRQMTVCPTLEPLENRLVLSVAPPSITLDPVDDEFGARVRTVTQLGNTNRGVLSIFDTGSALITVASVDQASFTDAAGNSDPIPIKNPNGASGNGIGGPVSGDVSQPLTILMDGVHAATLGVNVN